MTRATATPRTPARRTVPLKNAKAAKTAARAAAPAPSPATDDQSDDVEGRMYRAIYDSVLNQRLKPGAKLPEASLCELFGTSRFVVRKVLERLAHDHVVELQPNRGARIVMPSREEAQHVLEARRGLEAAIVTLATQRASKRELADFRRELGKDHSAMHSGDQVAWARVASSFHHRLAQLAQSPILEQYLAQTLSRFSLIVALYELPDNPTCEHEEHERIVDCMARGDAAGAAREMELHLRDLESGLVDKRDQADTSLARLLGLG